MRRSLRLALISYAGAAVTALILFLVACSNIQIDSQPAAAPINAPTTSESQETSQLRTKEVFDRNKNKGLLTIRYLYLNSTVGAGDAIVIQSPDGKTMMIDAGIIANGGQVVSYLDRLGIETIDVALNTHPHADHIGGFASVFEKKKVGKFYMRAARCDHIL